MTKQTLYVPVTIYDDHNTGIIVKHIHSGHKYPVNKKTGYFFTEEQLNELLSNVIKNTLKTAAEKAEVVMRDNCSDHTPYWGHCVSCGRTDNPSIPTEEVDKQSILNTFEETYLKHKV
jgi:hypothetical protein